MHNQTSFLKRFIALAVALVLLVSNVNLGFALPVFAAEDGNAVRVSELVADNYELTEAEEAILRTDYFAGEVTVAPAPTNGAEYVTIDTDAKTITASAVDGWVPVAAHIMLGEEQLEEVALTDGFGTYTYGGNAFSVSVDYTLDVEVAADVQTRMLGLPAALATEMGLLADAYEADANLGTVALALDVLLDLANGITMNFGTGSANAKFGVEAATAIRELKGEADGNGGQLLLQVKNNEYANSENGKSGYLFVNGDVYKDVLDNTYAALSAIKNDQLTNNFILDSYLEGYDPAGHTQWMAFKNILNGLVASLEAPSAAEWTLAGQNETYVAAGFDGAALDTLVAAVTETTAMPEVVNPLHVASTTLNVNMSMVNVNVTVELKVVTDEADSAELVTYDTKTATVIVAEGATAAEALADIEAKGIEAAALADWAEVYSAEHFAVTKTELPATVDVDTDYTITYAPVNYTITTGYGDPMTVPYGYKYTLPAHENASQAYDYTVNGEAMAQGEVVVVTGDVEITRTAGKAYTVSDLYTIIADNYGNDVVKAILKSGAVKGNSVVNVRKPDPADAESLLTLEAGTLSAAAYPASYAGLSWAPYTYGANGTENFFSGTEATWADKFAKVQYKLTLTNYSAEQVAEILDLAATLKTEAADQTGTLDALAANYDSMGMLDKTKLGALKGVIGVTDFTPDDGTDTDAKNAELRAYFAEVVDGIMANNLDTNNYLKIYNMLGQYKAEGLRYYYFNSAALIAEIDSLSTYLTELVADEEKEAALGIMVAAAGFPDIADKITDLEGSMNTVKETLTTPNAAINLNSDKLGALVAALTAEGEAVATGSGNPYLLSEVLTIADSSMGYVQVIIETPVGNATLTSAPMDKGTVLTADVLSALKADAEAKVAELLGANAKYYVGTVSEDLDALAGTALEATISVYYTYTEKTYTVKIDGEADQTISISDLEINLPKHTAQGWVYKYTVDGVEDITTSTYTFTLEQIDRLFTDGTYTITRIGVDEASEKLDGAFEDWVVRNEEDVVVGLNAVVSGTDFMSFAMTLVNSGYTYIGFNGEAFLYIDDVKGLQVNLAAVVNALMNDELFTSESMIGLGDGEGEYLHASMQLGNSAEDLHYTDLPFTLTQKNAPGIMGTVANGLDAISPYMTFKTVDGILNVDINLPRDLYEVYLTAMLVSGNLDKSDINEINSEIAFQFFMDYVNEIVEDDAITATTYANTLAKLGKNIDLAKYEDYYQLARKALKHEGVQINPVENEEFEASVTAVGSTAVSKLVSLAGIAIEDMYLAMIDDSEINVNVKVNLVDADYHFEAALVDVHGNGVANKLDFTSDLPARCASISGAAAVILLDDIDGNLNFPGTTVLDLNGMDVNGSITGNGSLYIVDSSRSTANAGAVSGTVSGAAVITGGIYASDVSAFLKEGYKQVDGVVQNCLFTVEANEDGFTYVVNSDFLEDESVETIPNVKALAIDIVVDVILDYYTAAALTVDGDALYHVDLYDLIDLIASDSKIDAAVQRVLASIDLPGMSDFADNVIADLLDFDAMAEALRNNTTLATYAITTAPWYVDVQHNTEEDYLTFGVGSDASNAKNYNVSLKIVGTNKDRVVPLLKELGRVVDATVDVNLYDPTYADKTLSIVGDATAHVTLDLNGGNNLETEYPVIMAVILANGNPDKKDALVSAVNANDLYALKQAIDDITVENVFTALKTMNRSESFKAMANKVGIVVDVEDEAALERMYHVLMVAAGKALEVVDITGNNWKFGRLDKDGDGVYGFEPKSATRSPEVTKRGYTVNVTGTVTASLTIELFNGSDMHGVYRLSGTDRAATARKAAVEFEDILHTDKFDNILYASAYNFPDALTGTYLSSVLDAPILMHYSDAANAENYAFIRENLAADGTVFILGGEAAVPAKAEEELKALGVNVVRLSGKTRYETNLEILKETHFSGGEVLVACGHEFADSLSASATGKAVLLVDNSKKELRASQVEYLKSLPHGCEFIIVGGSAAVNTDLEAALKELDNDGRIERLSGKTRYETSLMVAERFYGHASKVVLADGGLFPDALSAGAIAYSLRAPVILTSNARVELAAGFIQERAIDTGYVMGGTARLSDETVVTAFALASADEIIVK